MREGRAQAQAVERFSAAAPREAQLAVNQRNPNPRCVAVVGPSTASLAVTLGSLIDDIVVHGHQVVCFAPGADAQAARSFARIGVTTHRLPSFRQGLSPIADPRSVHRPSAVFRQTRPDVVAGYSPEGAALAAMAAAWRGSIIW